VSQGVIRLAVFVVVVVLGALVAAPLAAACVCVEATIDERLDDADAAVVGRIVNVERGEVAGAAERLLTIEVDQRVKGDVERTFVARSPSGTDCDVTVPEDRATGLLLTRAPDDAWLANACGVVEPGALVVAGGEPRGGTIKVGIGLVILALVLLWAFVRLRRGTRPELPGPPGA
jgi:hypothetical protein